MASLARGQENTPSILNWFTSIDGVLTDFHAVEFQIWDVSGGLPGTQVFPAAPGTWEDVTTGDGHYSVGHYYAYDNANSRGWTVPLGEPLGTHRAKWRWKVQADSEYQSDAEDFEVLVVGAGSSVDTYITVQDVRDAGITVAMASDEAVLAAIELWQEFLDRATRQWFTPKTLIMELDGNDTQVLHFPVPIIEIDYIKINNSPDELDETLYKVYNSRRLPDDRRNPRVKLVRTEEYRDIYTAPVQWGELKFNRGRQNQEVKGTFGFTDQDGGVPRAIKRALLLLVVEKLTRPVYPDPSNPITPSPIAGGAVVEEVTDDHKLKYADTSDKRKSGLSGITSNQEVLDIIKLYRNPLAMNAPADWTYGG